MDRRWYTKEDVMKDLAFANGVPNLAPGDDSYIISGSRPPPPRQCEDDEYEDRFGRYGGVNQDNWKPDLKGIAEMVRLVNNDESPRNESRPKRTEVNSGIVISKLNPNVPEFKPKTFATNGRIKDSSEALKEETAIKKEAGTVATPTSTSPQHHNQEQQTTKGRRICHSTNEQTCKNFDLNDDDDQQAKKELEAMLKGKILEATKAKTIKEKSARNVAIAALLKLKSGPPPSPKTPLTNSSESTSDSTPHSRDSNSSPTLAKQTIVLNPPTFYKQKYCATPNLENEISMPQSSEPETSSEENKPVDKKAVGAATLLSVAGVVAVEDREKIESIKKVEDWLDNTKKPKPVVAPHPSSPITFKRRDPKPHLGPLVYTKKARSIASPVSVSDDNKSSEPQPSETKKEPSQPTAFVPSQYASELARKYEERAKAKENAQLDIWSKLEKDLKAKDKAVRQRMREKEASSNASPSCSTGSSGQ